MSNALSAARATWLPPAPPPVELSRLEPWRPAGITGLLGYEASRADRRWEELRHIVIDELEEDTVGLVISSWPRIDGRGRLRFGEEEKSLRIATPSGALLELLAKERIVPLEVADDARVRELLRRRDLAVGDVFAAFLIGDSGGSGPGDRPEWGGGPGGGGSHESLEVVLPEHLLRMPVLDITAEARDAVKAQASAAASGIIDDTFLERVAAEFGEDEGEPPEHTPEGNPSNSNSGGSGGAEQDSSVDSDSSLLDVLTDKSSEPSQSAESQASRRDRPMEMGA